MWLAVCWGFPGLLKIWVWGWGFAEGLEIVVVDDTVTSEVGAKSVGVGAECDDEHDAQQDGEYFQADGEDEVHGACGFLGFLVALLVAEVGFFGFGDAGGDVGFALLDADGYGLLVFFEFGLVAFGGFGLFAGDGLRCPGVALVF